MTKRFRFVRLSTRNRVAWLEFDRPPVNAFNREMVTETRSAIEAALSDPESKVMVLGSANAQYFSAGADLRVFSGMKSDGMRRWVSECHDIARLLRNSAKPCWPRSMGQLSAVAWR